MTPMKTIRTTLVSAIYRQIGSCFGLFDIAGQTQFDVANKYTMYVNCRKIYNLCVRALETGRKSTLWQAFVASFPASANSFYI
jgi:hypothetical protein